MVYFGQQFNQDIQNKKLWVLALFKKLVYTTHTQTHLYLEIMWEFRTEAAVLWQQLFGSVWVRAKSKFVEICFQIFILDSYRHTRHNRWRENSYMVKESCWKGGQTVLGVEWNQAWPEIIDVCYFIHEKMDGMIDNKLSGHAAGVVPLGTKKLGRTNTRLPCCKRERET